ncbi:MAG: tagaturonate reductase [Bacilli bacterium]|nr:tagaturonate reductase [Bacilli bacterium]
MVKIVQFGEGNFLRTFVDLYLDTLNKEGSFKYGVTIIKSVPFGSIEQFKKQNCKYNVVLRGRTNGKDVEDVYKVDSVEDAIDLYEDKEAFYRLAEDPEVKLIVSNTTEAGIVFNEFDKKELFPDVSYPAKLVLWLYQRYKSNLSGVYILPVELIDNNAQVLEKCVNDYIDLFELGKDFKKWNAKNNFYCNTLVDRIVSGHPKDKETESHLYDLVGHEDKLLSVGEPFGLWVIEDKGDIKNILKDGHHNIDVIFTKDISYYKKRKVRVLNGSHTNMVPVGLWLGKETVYDVMNDKALSSFVDKTLKENIIPFVSSNIEETTFFAEDVKQRFLNPYLNHQLTSIALNSISKWKARVLPSFSDFYQKNHRIPKYFAIGFAYLISMYMNIEKIETKYFCHLPNRVIEVKDDERYLNYFNEKNVHDFLSDKSIWDIDLTSFENFETIINNYLIDIKKGKNLIEYV